MAVVQYTAVVNQVRGKLNGSVFNKARNANTLQRKQQQPQGQRGNQVEVRSEFNSAQRSWKLLSSSTKSAWALVAANNPDRDRFGDQVILSGYNKYLQARMNTAYNGSAVSNPPPTASEPPLSVTLDQSSVPTFTVQSDGSIEAALLVNLQWTGRPVIGVGVAISLPVSTGVTRYHGRYVSLGSVTTTGNLSAVSFSKNLGQLFPVPQVGQKIMARITVVSQGNGVVIWRALHEHIF